MAGNGISRGLTFGGMIGAVMIALKLKERFDDYDTLPTDEEGLGHGPVALRSPNLEEDALDSASFLDTQLPTSGRPKRQRKADCCVCCGLRCGLFWKAFGIVCALFFGWQLIKLALWAAKPKETGLEGMPEFSTSLGCVNAPHLYRGGKLDISVPVGQKNDHDLDFRGAAVGTIVVAQGEASLKDIKYELTLRTDAEDLFQDVLLEYPTQADIDDATKDSHLRLVTPSDTASSCMRFDATLYIPPTVKALHIQAHATTQIKFDADSNFNFDKLFVTMYRLDSKNMLLPTENIHANDISLQLTSGWLVGDVTVVDEASLISQRGDAVMDVRVHPAPSSSETPAPAKLLTSTGAGRSNVFFVSHSGFPHRPIDSTHQSSLNGDLYLTYTDTAFNGTVDLTAKSFSATGLSNPFGKEGGLPYVGSQDGSDKMLVKSQGWVGLYF